MEIASSDVKSQKKSTPRGTSCEESAAELRDPRGAPRATSMHRYETLDRGRRRVPNRSESEPEGSCSRNRLERRRYRLAGARRSLSPCEVVNSEGHVRIAQKPNVRRSSRRMN